MAQDTLSTLTDCDSLYGAIHRLVLRQAIAKVRDPDFAADLAQDVMVVLLERYPNVKQLDDLALVASVTLRFKVKGARRKAFRRTPHVDPEDIVLEDLRPSPEVATLEGEIRDLIPRALERLPRIYQEMIGEELDGKSLAEIIASSGLKTGTVYARSSRARQALVREIRQMARLD